MRSEDAAQSRALRLALFDQMEHTIELMGMLLEILRKAELSPRQKGVLQHWERALPELRKGLKLVRGTRPAKKPRAKGKKQAG